MVFTSEVVILEVPLQFANFVNFYFVGQKTIFNWTGTDFHPGCVLISVQYWIDMRYVEYYYCELLYLLFLIPLSYIVYNVFDVSFVVLFLSCN